MTTNEMRKLILLRPFEPFTLHLADGRSFAVTHPECVALAPGSRVAVVGHDKTYDFVDLLLVTSVETKPPESSAA